jgi:hypothetical protein
MSRKTWETIPALMTASKHTCTGITDSTMPHSHHAAHGKTKAPTTGHLIYLKKDGKTSPQTTALQ